MNRNFEKMQILCKVLPAITGLSNYSLGISCPTRFLVCCSCKISLYIFKSPRDDDTTQAQSNEGKLGSAIYACHNAH